MSEAYAVGEPILHADNLQKRFGGIIAVDGATFDLKKGLITGLIGPNGAGKTTTFNMLSGFYRPDGGHITLKGERLYTLMRPTREEKLIWTVASAGTFALGGMALAAQVSTGIPTLGAGAIVGLGLGTTTYFGQQYVREHWTHTKPTRPYQLSKHGLSRTFQITRELANMTVLENLMLGAKDQRGEKLRNVWFRPEIVQFDEATISERAFEILELLQLSHLANDYAGNLSGGQRKLLELGRVLMTDPDLVLLDEPVAGVNPSLRENLLRRIQELRDEGYSFCIVEHDMDVIMRLSDEVIVMDRGDVLLEGPPEIIREDARVIDAYLGG